MDENMELLLRLDPKDEVSDDIIRNRKTFKDALKLCKEISGLTDLQISQALDIDPGQWSRIWQCKANFPDEKVIQFIRLCNNLIPLRWLALTLGYGIHPLKSHLEIENEQLKKQLEQQRIEMDAIKKFVKETRE